VWASESSGSISSDFQFHRYLVIVSLKRVALALPLCGGLYDATAFSKALFERAVRKDKGEYRGEADRDRRISSPLVLDAIDNGNIGTRRHRSPLDRLSRRRTNLKSVEV
jgi:hypothetical protein